MGIVFPPPSVSPGASHQCLEMTLTYLIFVCTWLHLWTFRLCWFVCLFLYSHHILFNLSVLRPILIPDQWVVNESHFQIFLCYLSLLFSSWTSKSWRQVSRKFHLRPVGVQTNLQIILKGETSFQKCTFSFWAARPVCRISLILRHHQVWATSLIW